MANTENLKINIDVLESYIEKHSDEIRKLDEKSLPAVLLEMQHEEYSISDKSVPARKITEISLEVISKVLLCWSYSEVYDLWISEMISICHPTKPANI